jgi:hypothetical protein
MNARLVISPIVALLLSLACAGQQVTPGDSKGAAARQTGSSGEEFKESLLHRIAIAETAVRQAESARAGNAELGSLYAQLALLYEDAAQFERSEVTLEHSVSLLRHTPGAGANLTMANDQQAALQVAMLATAVAQLGSLHVAMRKLRESEGEEQEALRLRVKLGDQVMVARSWNDLAALALAERKFPKARDFAQRALNEFTANDQAAAIDRLSARYALAMAFCNLKNYASAVPIIKDAIEEGKAKLVPGDFPIGFGTFLLGYAYWKAGDMPDAAENLRVGTIGMSEQLGWGHPSYLEALKQYAKFLRENRQADVASAVELRIRQAESVVDVHALQKPQGTFGVNGLR